MSTNVSNADEGVLPDKYSFLKEKDGVTNARVIKFNFAKSGGKLLPQKFRYSIGKSAIRLGPLILDMRLMRLNIDVNKSDWDLGITWPSGLVRKGLLQVFDDNGKVLWEEDFDEDDIGSKIKLGSKKVGKRSHKFYRFTEKDISSGVISKLKVSKNIKACVSSVGTDYNQQLCSKPLKIEVTNNRVKLLGKKKTKIKVTISGKRRKKRGLIVVGQDVKDKVDFMARLENGSFIKLETAPAQFKILDAVKTSKGLLVEISGARPLAKNVKITEDGIFKVLAKKTKKGGSTDFRVTLSGPGGVPFLQQIFLSQELPRASDELKFHSRSMFTTYDDHSTLYGYVKPKLKLQSIDGVATRYESNYTVWNVGKLIEGQVNSRDILVVDGTNRYTATVDVYRGYDIELGARLTGVALVESKKVLVLADILAGAWYESIFGWENYYFGRQRWGTYFKYFQNLTRSGSLQDLTVTSFDLKYRAMPGIWEKDATVGLILGYQTVKFNENQAPMLGVGGFWARSMPSFFDRIFNIIPFLRYPKWVDMELISYVSSLDPKLKLGTNFVLNFHGKMLVTTRFFIEGGVSVRDIQFTKVSTNEGAQGSLVAGTFGFGLNF